MNPVSYKSMPPSMNGGHPNLSLDHLLSKSNVMYCEKCGFASTDTVVFKKHMIEHMGTKFICFYCNSVSFSEAELNEHLKQHTSKYPFKCPHCGQGYMRRRCLMKHIDRLHSKNISQGPAKPSVTRSPLDSVSSALTSAHTADPLPLRPVVRVTVPTPVTPVIRLGRDEPRVKTLDINVPNASNGNADHFSPLNGLIQHNRALTVALPEEVTIPAGCLVELVEVKTVNGTKELKLRLISQQENGSVIKDTKATVPQNFALGKPLSSTLHHPNTVRSMSMGMCTVNRKQFEPKKVNVEHAAVVPVSISNPSPNVVNKEKSGLKRASPEIINLECNTVIPSKVSKSIHNPVREGNSGIRLSQTVPANHSTAAPSVISSRIASMSSRVSTALHPASVSTVVPQRLVEERRNTTPEHSKGIPPRRASDSNNIQDKSAAVKVEPGEIHRKSNSPLKGVKEVVCLNRQSTPTSNSMTVPVSAAAPVRHPVILTCKDNVVDKTFPRLTTLNKPPSMKTPVLPNHTNSKASTWTQEVRSNVIRERHVPKPESFPVISSVFSLSEQPEKGQGSMQPLLMALRGIVMDKKPSPGSANKDHVTISKGPEQTCKSPTLKPNVEVPTKNGSFTHDVILTKQPSETVKVEKQSNGVKQTPQNTQSDVSVKEENSSTTKTLLNACSDVPSSKSPECEIPKTASQVEASVAEVALQQTDDGEPVVSPKFLTICLKRVQLGVWKKSKKGLKVRISRFKPQIPVGRLTDCTVIYPMPLKKDQLVKRPGPNQPVVVLNHPKPRVSAQGPRADTVADMGAPEAAPKCQILKMRLGKVVGHKYEVMGCTVGDFQ
ncbi:zonadhesin [Cololabis saira]|uniref:zonadhesin n=1 Tax=Cololabis saira TaxID=129043 RepID=UPI002AD3E383|nr:zonadhesin [Cololabis saira]